MPYGDCAEIAGQVRKNNRRNPPNILFEGYPKDGGPREVHRQEPKKRASPPSMLGTVGGCWVMNTPELPGVQQPGLGVDALFKPADQVKVE